MYGTVLQPIWSQLPSCKVRGHRRLFNTEILLTEGAEVQPIINIIHTKSFYHTYTYYGYDIRTTIHLLSYIHFYGCDTAEGKGHQLKPSFTLHTRSEADSLQNHKIQDASEDTTEACLSQQMYVALIVC